MLHCAGQARSVTVASLEHIPLPGPEDPIIGIGVFELIVLIVLISTIGKVLTARSERPQLPRDRQEPEALLQLNDALSEMNARLAKLEEERDFYRALLESPRRGEIQPPPDQGPPPSDD